MMHKEGVIKGTDDGKGGGYEMEGNYRRVYRREG